MVIASELKEGTFIRIEGQIYKVLEAESRAGAAKLSGVVKTKLRNVSGGRMWEPHFRPDERLEDVEAEQQTLEFLFSDADSCTFMDPRSFEQIEVPRAILGVTEQFLQPGMQVQLQFFESRPISAVFPDIVDARVASTTPPAHSQQDSTWKEATLDNGLRIRVPLFIAPGEFVRVEVQTGRYVERAKSERKRSA
jgi:elongation factor P